MRTYITERYGKNEVFRCGHGCGNVTFSSLPRSAETQCELTWCTKCGVGILFSTTELPRKIGYPLSRRQWGEVTEILPVSKLRWAGVKMPQF